ncbi:MAG TPA: aldo/keto reductase, partial [Thermoplasmata archaeon]|nr:aldo/keto reductase [Thermoplasmata archaeon]
PYIEWWTERDLAARSARAPRRDPPPAGTASPDREPVLGCYLPARLASAEDVVRLSAAGVAVVGTPVHLLGRPFPEEVGAALERTGMTILALDPFARGRLNGAWFGLRRTAPALGPRPPPDPAQLRREAAPILSLGFLSESGRRTLAQAAIQWALLQPGVASVVIDARSVEEVEEALGALAAPPISDDELARIERVREADPPGAEGDGRVASLRSGRVA